MNTADYDEFRTYYDYQIENYIKSTQNLNEQKATLAKLVNLQNNDINDVAQADRDHDVDDDSGDRKLQWMLVNYFDKQNLGHRNINELMDTTDLLGPKLYFCLDFLLRW